MARVNLPDGRVVNFPDTMSPEQITAAMRGMSAPQANVSRETQAPEIGLGTKAVRAAEFGSRGVMDAAAEVLGAFPELAASSLRSVGLPAPQEGFYPETIKSGMQKFGETISAPINAAFDFGPSTPQSDLERAAYGAGRGVADVASFMVPGAAVSKLAQAGSLPARVGGAVASQPLAQLLAGATAGGVTEATDSPAMGLAASLAVPTGAAAARNVARKAVTPFPSQLSPNEQRLAQAAENAGIELTPGQLTGSPSLRTMESAFTQLPFTAKSQGEKFAGQRTAFNRAVLEKAGINADDASPEVLDKAFTSIGREFDDLAAQTTIKPDQQLIDDVSAVVNDYGRRLTSDVAPVFNSYLDDFAKLNSAMGQPGAAVEISGKAYQSLSSDIKRRARSASNNPELQQALFSLSSTLDDALQRSGGPELRAAWGDVRNRYRNMLAIDKAVGGGTAGTRAAADIPFGGLRTAVRGMDKSGYARGRGDLNELSRVGDFLSSAIPADSGTARRSLIQGLLTGGAGGGGATYMATGGNPLAALLMAGAAVGGPKVAQTAYNIPAIQSYLKNQRLPAPKQSKRSLAELLGKVATAQAIGQTTE